MRLAENCSATHSIMTQKLFRFLPGAIAFLLASAPMVAAQGQTPAQQPAQQRPAQAAPRQQINLTPAQQAEIEKIRQSALTQIRGVLTKEQQAQIDAAEKPGAQPQQVSLNLSQDQRTRINAIVEASRKQIVEKVLTQDQRNQLMQTQPSQPQR